jgi:hypothetical protein
MTVTINGTTGVAGVDGTASTPAIQGNDINTGIFFPAADTIAFAEGGAEVARFDSSGNLGLGTTSPASKLNIGANDGTAYSASSSTGQAGVGATIQLTNLATSANATSQILFNMNNDRVINRIVSSYTSTEDGYLAFVTEGAATPAERMRINSSGQVLINGTSNFQDAKLEVNGDGTNTALAVKQSTTSSRTQISFNNPNGVVGQVSTSGSSTSYVTSSDYRLKEDIEPMTGALAVVGQLKPCTYKWKADGSDGQGFIAHELAEVVPDCVTGKKDEVETYLDEEGVEQTRPKYQGIDTSFLVATLTAAIQEQQAIITDLTNRLTVLENNNVGN